MERLGIIIPARYASSRFPGKPLTPINGVPMIEHTWRACLKSKYVTDENIFIATDSKRIAKVSKSFGANVVMTSDMCLTGTDRLAEANQILKYDQIINVQGDEPVISALDIDKIYEKSISDERHIYCGFKKIDDVNEFTSLNIPKVVFNETNRLIYMSRSSIPLAKSGKFSSAIYKQACVYVFRKHHLDFFAQFGRKSLLEQIEDIELLRFFESNYEIHMVEIEKQSIAVDTEADVKKVEDYLFQKK